MTDPTPPSDPPRRPAWRRWLRRGLWTGLGLVTVAAVFHRPILRFAGDHIARHLLEKNGMSLTWNLSGTVTSDLALDDVRITGKPGSLIPSLTLSHFDATYDLWRLRTSGPGTLVDTLTIRKLDATVDLTKPAPKPTTPKPQLKPSAPPAVTLPQIVIEDVSLRLLLPDHSVRVENFSLTLQPGGTGTLTLRRLEAPGIRPLENVHALTAATAQTLTLTDLSLWPEILVRELALDLSTLPGERVPLRVSGHHGEATGSASLTVSNWSQDLSAAGTISAADVSARTLAYWGIPDGGSDWSARTVEITVDGPVLRPDKLSAGIRITAGPVNAGPVPLDGGAAHIVLGGGRLDLSDGSARAGENFLTYSLNAALPSTWAPIGRAEGAAEWALTAPQAARLLPPDTPFQGSLTGKGSAAFRDLKLLQASADVSGSSLHAAGIPIEALHTSATLRDGTLILAPTEVRLNAENTLTASGSLGLTDARDFTARWTLRCPDLSTVPADLRGDGIPWPAAGSVDSQGEAAGSLAGLTSGDFRSLTGNATLNAAGVKIRQAALDSLTLTADAAGGRVNVQTLALALNDTNTLTLKGGAALDGPGEFTADAKAALPDLKLLTPWLALAGGPEIRQGGASADWSGSGRWREADITGSGSVKVTALRLGEVPDELAAAAAVAHEGRVIRLTGLQASAGKWRAGGDLTWTGTRLEVPSLDGFAGAEKVVHLAASLPLAPGRPGGLIDEDAPLSLTADVEKLDVQKLSAALGQQWPALGVFTADLKADGSLRAFTAGLKVAGQDLRIRHRDAPVLDPGVLTLTLNAADGVAVLDGNIQQRPLEPLTIKARLPLDLPEVIRDSRALLTAPLQAEVHVPQTDLAFLADKIPALRSVNGHAAVDLRISGTIQQPAWDGSVHADVPEVTFASASLPTVKDVSLRLRGEGMKLVVEDASVLLAGGRLKVTGAADFTRPADPALDFTISATEILAVRDENLSLRADAALTCRGTLKSAEVSGRVDLVRGRVYKEIEYLPLSLPNQLPPAPPPARLTKEGGPTLPPPFDKWTADIAVQTRDPIRLMGNLARGGVVVDVKLTGTGAKPELTGTASLKDAWIKLPYSRVTIPRGVLTFTTEDPFDPRIDLLGESLVGDRQVNINLQGRALDPLIRLSSSPPLPEGEIATLLATGVTTDDLQSSGDVAAGRAAWLVVSDTYHKLFGGKRKVSDEPPRLTFDFSLLGNDSTGRTVSAIYEFNPKVKAIGRVSERGTFRGLLYYLIRFR